MSSRNKLYKFARLLEMDHVIQNFASDSDGLIGKGYKPLERKGVWSTDQFSNPNPIVLELACGRGEYAVGLGQLYPEMNFIGVDVKGARIFQGASQAIEQNLNNVAFLRCRIERINRFFAKDEVDKIWITFPDPFLKTRKSNRRLTSPYFLDVYRQILKPSGTICLKTDEPVLYDYTLKILEDYPSQILTADRDLYKGSELSPDWQIKTHYENLHIADGDQICGLEFRLL